jgi:hypothetical protein
MTDGQAQFVDLVGISNTGGRLRCGNYPVSISAENCCGIAPEQ